MAKPSVKPEEKREAKLLVTYTDEIISHTSEALEQTGKPGLKESQERRSKSMLQVPPQFRQVCPTDRITAAVLPSGSTEEIKDEKMYLIKTFPNLTEAIAWMEKQKEIFDLRILGVGDK